MSLWRTLYFLLWLPVFWLRLALYVTTVLRSEWLQLYHSVAHAPLEYIRCFIFSTEPEIATVKPICLYFDPKRLPSKFKLLITNDFQPQNGKITERHTKTTTIFNQSTESTNGWRFRVIVIMSHLQKCIKLGQNVYLKEIGAKSKNGSSFLDSHPIIRSIGKFRSFKHRQHSEYKKSS